ncbi:hypothetical protein OG863_01175 [Streptomyces decoyicus]|uniref:Uncharacterized protein n=1 Tax=Streptomyces decoyicus TaxID=249567 RepID=A0ABZ1F9B2_9ACTN|nr:hypothetical protein [Streptomyces decoyicus]WSB66694.1 hypothetical protein OG863_01175 [Streptomyces decoyicus]
MADVLTIELVRHSVAEEVYLYPAVGDHLEEGDALAGSKTLPVSSNCWPTSRL